MPINVLIDGLPDQSMLQEEFDEAVGKFMAELPQFAAQANALEANVNGKETAAQNSALVAAQKAGAAAQSALDAAARVEDAQARALAAGNSAAQADVKASEAAASALASANSAAAVAALSNTQHQVGNGRKTFVIPAGKQFLPHQPVCAASANAKMFGSVFEYAGTQLTLDIEQAEGAGTFDAWSITAAGAQGRTGGTAGGKLTDALDEKKSSSPASSASPDIWNAGGNYVPIVQVEDITGFPNAPQAGARRYLFIINPLNLVSGANLIVRGGTRRLRPGDEVEVVADTASTFIATIKRGNGLPVSSLSFLRADLYLAAATVIARVAGPHRAILAGAGGSGAKASIAQSATSTASATGGAAGGLAIKDYDAAVGDVFSYLPGAPGAAVAANANGNAGAPSTYDGPGVALVANGGAGGMQSTSSVAAVPGAIGGLATGGDFNLQGGNSGSCAANKRTSGSSGSAQATGGGAVSWAGTPTKSGDVECSSTSSASYLASGGASPFFSSGDVKPTSAPNTGVRSSSGGAGTGGPSPHVTAAVATVGANGPGKPGLNLTPVNLIGNGAGATSGAGGGSPGATGVGATSVDAGALAGSGAIAVVGTTAAGAVGAPGWGAGSGGAAADTGPAITMQPGGISILIVLS